MTNIMYLHAGAEMYGADKVLLDLIKNLDKSEFTPFVVLPTEGQLVTELKAAGVQVCVMPYPILRRKYFNLKGIFEYVVGLIKYTGKLSQLAREKKIHIVHANTAATMEGCFVASRCKIPLVWSIHEIIVEPRLIYKMTSKMIAHYADLVIAVSGAVKDHLEKAGYFKKNQVAVIYNGVDTKRFNPEVKCEYLYKEWDIPAGAKIFGMSGRVNRVKGQLDFVKAANIVLEEFDMAYAVLIGNAFAGEEWREKELNEKISQSPYRNRILNMGYRTDNAEIYSLLDVFVLPSVGMDSLPTVVLESMAEGKPVVAYRQGGVCEMIEDGYNGLFAEVGNTEELAKQISALLENDAKRTQMGKNALEHIKKFSMETYVDKVSKVYKSMRECGRR